MINYWLVQVSFYYEEYCGIGRRGVESYARTLLYVEVLVVDHWGGGIEA